MPYRVCKSIEIESGHMLSKHPDHCRFPHGHSRKVEFVLEAEDLDDSDMVCDFKIIKHAIGAWLDRFDHALCVNTDDPAYEELKARYGERIIDFEQQDPTTEAMAKRIHDYTSGLLKEYAQKPDVPYPLRASVRLVSVKVWETSSSWAEYFIS
jgi:6-pyruvoyltetrahydropterin/6-carboxytetrahydropterin synthase